MIPSQDGLASEIARQFPGVVIRPEHQLFMGFVVNCRRLGMGYGWMRQIIGIAWRLEDPDGALDDEKIAELARR